MQNNLNQILSRLSPYFVSSNEIKIERATIPTKEWEAFVTELTDYVKRLEDNSSILCERTRNLLGSSLGLSTENMKE